MGLADGLCVVCVGIYESRNLRMGLASQIVNTVGTSIYESRNLRMGLAPLTHARRHPDLRK